MIGPSVPILNFRADFLPAHLESCAPRLPNSKVQVGKRGTLRYCVMPVNAKSQTSPDVFMCLSVFEVLEVLRDRVPKTKRFLIEKAGNPKKNPDLGGLGDHFTIIMHKKHAKAP